jgi:hypothetical protein
MEGCNSWREMSGSLASLQTAGRQTCANQTGGRRCRPTPWLRGGFPASSPFSYTQRLPACTGLCLLQRIPGLFCISKAPSSGPPIHDASFLFLLSLFEEHLFLSINIFLLHPLPFHLNCKQPAVTPLLSLPICPSSSLHIHPIPLPHKKHYSPFLSLQSILSSPP